MKLRSGILIGALAVALAGLLANDPATVGVAWPGRTATLSSPHPVWREVVCAEGNQHVKIGQEAYFLSADGYLMPTKKDQSPPDLKYFKPQK